MSRQEPEELYSSSRKERSAASSRLSSQKAGRHAAARSSAKSGSSRSTAASRAGRSAPPKRSAAAASAPRRRAPLQDRYTYEEPYSDRFDDIYSDSARRTSRPENRSRGKEPPRKKKSVQKRLILFFLVVMLLVGFGLYYVFWYMLGGLTFNGITDDRSRLGINSGVLSDDGIKNIALFGLDAREDENEGRSDALMILTVDNKHDKLKITSILRDSNVSIRLTDDDGDVYYMDDKITHAYAYGGPECAINALNRNFHLDIEDYVTVNFIQMAKIVDAFGGVYITISYDEMVEINNNLAMQQWESADAEILDSDYLYEYGEMLLNGNQAVAYARIRHLEGGDDIRAERQQTVLKALISRLRNKSKLEYPELIHKLMPLCETSLDFSDIMSMSPIILTDFTVETLSIPGEEEDPRSGYNSSDAWVYVYDLERAANHINRFIYEENAVPVTLGADVTDIVSWDDEDDSYDDYDY